jgi:4-hydroxybenzoate polyprenyltransferase
LPSHRITISPYHLAVRRFVLRIITAIQLTRLTMAFGAISDVWLIILFTRQEPRYSHLPVFSAPLPLALFAGAVVAIGLFAYGASLNDVLDARHDSAFSPERPIPAGRIRAGQAMVVTVGSLMVGLLGAWAFGQEAFLVTLLTGAAILFYNAAGRFIPVVGIITIGLIHAAHMLIPNYQLVFMLPVWMVMTHSIGIAIAVHVLEDKRPRLNRKSYFLIGVGWLFWSILLLASGPLRGAALWPANVPLIGLAWPALAVVAFVVVARWKATGIPGRSAAEKMKRYGAMWQALYGAAWLAAVQLYPQALVLGIFAVSGFIVMTIIREITGLSGRPITYRG